MSTPEFLAERFEEHRPRLRAVAYRMLGSISDADDAVQEAWLRFSRAEPDAVQNLGGWLTTIVGRVCLTMLRTRTRRREEALSEQVFEPTDGETVGTDPEYEALLADSVGVALLVVLEALSPAERLAFVLHDLFSVPFDEIAPIVGRTEQATRKLASRARRRVQGSAPSTEVEVTRRREVVDTFLAAARGGDLEALIAILDPDVVVRSDGGSVHPGRVLRGARAVSEGAAMFVRLTESTRPALVDGSLGAVAMSGDRPISVAKFTIAGGKIVALDIVTDPERVGRLELTFLDE